VNRSFHFPAFVFVLLFALLFLLSGQLSRFSIPHAMRESRGTIDRAPLDRVPLLTPSPATKDHLRPDLSSVLTEIRRGFSGVGLFLSPGKPKPPVSDQRVYSSPGVRLSKVSVLQGEETGRPKNQLRSSGSRLRLMFLTRTYVRALSFFEHRSRHMTKGPSWKEIRNDIRKFERRLARFFGPPWHRGRYIVSTSR
jgi:hypothetical protein